MMWRHVPVENNFVKSITLSVGFDLGYKYEVMECWQLLFWAKYKQNNIDIEFKYYNTFAPNWKQLFMEIVGNLLVDINI